MKGMSGLSTGKCKELLDAHVCDEAVARVSDTTTGLPIIAMVGATLNLCRGKAGANERPQQAPQGCRRGHRVNGVRL